MPVTRRISPAIATIVTPARSRNGSSIQEHCAHLAVEVVRQYPVRNLRGANRTNVLEPVSPAKVRMAARPADEGLRDEVSDRKCIGIAVVREGIEFVVLLPMLDPDLPVAHRPDQHQALVEVDVVCP